MRWTVNRYGRTLKPGQRSELCIFDIRRHSLEVVLSTPELVEAPNWMPVGSALLVNAGGELWLVATKGSQHPAKIETGSLQDFNNDHLISPDGNTIYASSDDGNIYALPVTGGDPRRVAAVHEPRHHCYLHGISPDGATLVYVGLEKHAAVRRTNIFTCQAGGGASRRLTDIDLPNDGPEYSPDGQWIYFNSERASPGHSQCFRMRPDGTGVEQMTRDERVNWFPHPSPDGRVVAYLSYPPATRGHPPDRDVIVRLMDPDGTNHRDLVDLFGGQGTLNVNSWSPDSNRFAFVAYPIGSD